MRLVVQLHLAALEQTGVVYEHEGALWMRTTDTGDDKDRVLRRSDGENTYFASEKNATKTESPVIVRL